MYVCLPFIVYPRNIHSHNKDKIKNNQITVEREKKNYPNLNINFRYLPTMWNGKTFPLSPSTEKNLKAVLIKGQTHITYHNPHHHLTHLHHHNRNQQQQQPQKQQNNIKFVENATKANSKKCADRISIDMELLMQKKCIAHHSA